MTQTAPAILDDKSLWRCAGYIDGKWVSETAHGTYPVANPANGEVLALLPRCKEAESGGRVVDAILTNSMLPDIGRSLLEALYRGDEVKKITVKITDGNFTYEFA